MNIFDFLVQRIFLKKSKFNLFLFLHISCIVCLMSKFRTKILGKFFDHFDYFLKKLENCETNFYFKKKKFNILNKSYHNIKNEKVEKIFETSWILIKNTKKIKLIFNLF